MNKPLPCPFCACKEIRFQPGAIPGTEILWCSNCGGQTEFQESRQQAIDAWNQRPAHPQPLVDAEAADYAIHHKLIQQLASLVRIYQPEGAKVKWRGELIERESVIKVVVQMRDAIDAWFSEKRQHSQERAGWVLVPTVVATIPHEAWDNAATAFQIANKQHGFYESCFAAYKAWLRTIAAAPLAGSGEK